MQRPNPPKIPQPKTIPLLANILDVDGNAPVQSLIKHSQELGGIFRIDFVVYSPIVIGSYKLINDACDETRFEKALHAPLVELREMAKDGLFTAYNDEPNWGKAHRILLPAFAPVALRNMFTEMFDISEQMFLKWERLGDGAVIDVADNMTRLTLDTIALTTLGYRFNSFYEKTVHPFVEAMGGALKASSQRVVLPKFIKQLKRAAKSQFDEDVRLMHQIADQLVSERKKNGTKSGRKDLLEIMLHAKDSVTGEGLDDNNIRCQLVTFLIAGHETTSGLLSFAIYALLKNPEVQAKARAEVERIVGNRDPNIDDIPRLNYIDQILKESLRLWPTASAFAVQPKADETILGGLYPIKKDETILILNYMLHRDPEVWTDPEKFDPERMSEENFKKLPPNCWKPFGNGERSCIGRAFAMQESILVLTMLLQRFDFEFEDKNYKLEISETLTFKPAKLKIKVKKREINLLKAQPQAPSKAATGVNPGHSKKPMSLSLLVAYGSNMGSSEGFAQQIAIDARNQGYEVSIGSLDSYVDRLKDFAAVILLVSSYEGHPPDNGKNFVRWLKDASGSDRLRGVKYTVFGCGNRDWTRTYQAIPKLIDSRLQELGAERIFERGEADARSDFFGDFDRWYEKFWPQLSQTLGTKLVENNKVPELSIQFVSSIRDSILQAHKLHMAKVTQVRSLVDMSHPMARDKIHLEIELPEGLSYRAGDYLSVLPQNSQSQVKRVLQRFKLDGDSQMIIHTQSDVANILPINRPIATAELIANYVELAQPATQKQLEMLADLSPCPPEKIKILKLIETDAIYQKEVLEKRLSVLDVVESYQSCSISFAGFLQLLPPLKPRQYSISSSPLRNSKLCTLTVAVVKGPAYSGRGQYKGVTSNYLAQLAPGDSIAVLTKPSLQAFHLPDDPSIPIILACAGTGLAPFRGFLEERAIKRQEGQNLAPAILFFGCDHPDIDFLYREELQSYEALGVVQLRLAYSEQPRNGVKFVQDRILECRDEVMALYNAGAKTYVCGDGRNMAPAVKLAFGKIYQDANHASDEEVERWFTDLEKNIRYVADVFS